MESYPIYLTQVEMERLARWLTDYDRPPDFNLGRYRLLQEAGTDYISSRELGLLMDELYPLGSAIGIIQGKIEIQVSEVSG